jgi:hypothetical protein
MCTLLVSATLAACSVEESIDRSFNQSNQFSALNSQIDFSAPSSVATLSGVATYNGVAFVDFAIDADNPNGEFTGNADASLVADFDAQTVQGRLTGWEDLDPVNFDLQGQILLSNGRIENDGQLAMSMSGNIQRTARQSGAPTASPILLVFEGVSSGQIYDSVAGDEAALLRGSLDGLDNQGREVSGNFVASQ